jgi:NADH-quinone oxidoreductase subunit G
MSDAPSGVAAIVGDASNEEGYLVQRILREALGSPHVDSRTSRGSSRDTLLRLAQPGLSAKVRDLDEADAILVVGSDPLHTSPILDLRIRKAMRRNGARLAVATDRPTTLDGGAAAVYRYAPGNAISALPKLAQDDVLRDAERVVVLWGERIAREGGGATAALLDLAGTLDLASKDGSGLLEIPDLTNARGLREAGCLPDAGPGFSEATPGKDTEAIRAALESGELETLLLFGVDPLRDLPDTAAWDRALTAADNLIVFSTFENATTAKADVVFPLETHAEKDGTVTHPDGRLQRVRPSASRPGDIRPNWGVLAELSRALGHDTGIDSQPSAFAALTEAVPFYAGITDADIAGRGIRWQDRHPASSLPSAGTSQVPERASGAGSPETLSESESGDPAPDALTLGTYRDLWAGPITELSPPLKFLQPRQRVELSLSDAERLGLKNGDTVRVGRNGSAVEASVQIRERIEPGVCFLIEATAEGNANGLLNGSPVSVTIEKASA